MKIIVTGFEPFGDQEINPSELIVSKLENAISVAAEKSILKETKLIEVVKIVLPVTLKESVNALKKAVEEHKPDVVISIGQAGGRCDICLEMVGVNALDFNIPDNKGNMPENQAIVPDGQDAFFTTIPNRKVVDDLLENGIPASISYTAGTYVCNYVIYEMCKLLCEKYPNVKYGFIHVPYLPEQVSKMYKEHSKKGLPSMSLETMLRGIEIALIRSVEGLV